MAFTPKDLAGDKRVASLAIVAGTIGLFIVPILAVPTMVVGGWKWRAAPNWARGALIVIAVLFTIFLVMSKQHHGVHH